MTDEEFKTIAACDPQRACIACARIARREADHQRLVVATKVIDVVSKAAALKAEQVAERIARAIERGEK
jgi:hypothetical protein